MVYIYVVEVYGVHLHRVQKKVIYFVFEHNFTITGSIFLQFSVNTTE